MEQEGEVKCRITTEYEVVSESADLFYSMGGQVYCCDCRKTFFGAQCPPGWRVLENAGRVYYECPTCIEPHTITLPCPFCGVVPHEDYMCWVECKTEDCLLEGREVVWWQWQKRAPSVKP